MTQYKLSDQTQIRLQYLKTQLRSKKLKFIIAQEFRKNFVKVYESVQRDGESYGILIRGKVAVCLLPGEMLPAIMELVDRLSEEMIQS